MKKRGVEEGVERCRGVKKRREEKEMGRNGK